MLYQSIVSSLKICIYQKDIRVKELFLGYIIYCPFSVMPMKVMLMLLILLISLDGKINIPYVKDLFFAAT